MNKFLEQDITIASDGEDPLTISWKVIVEEFSTRYDQVYDFSASKVHLDLINQIIDGSKNKWKEICLLDCMLCFILGNDRGQRECSRRRFNQYTTLRECVCSGCGRAWAERLLSTDINTIVRMKLPKTILLSDVDAHWSDHNLLRSELLKNPPKKSTRKHIRIVEEYLSLGVFNSKTLADIILISVSIIYTQHFHPVTETLTRVKLLDRKDRQIFPQEESNRLERSCNQFIDYATANGLYIKEF